MVVHNLTINRLVKEPRFQTNALFLEKIFEQTFVNESSNMKISYGLSTMDYFPIQLRLNISIKIITLYWLMIMWYITQVARAQVSGVF